MRQAISQCQCMQCVFEAVPRATFNTHPTMHRTHTTHRSRRYANGVYPKLTPLNFESPTNPFLWHKCADRYGTSDGCPSTPSHLDVRARMQHFAQSIHLFPCLRDLTVSLLEPIAMQAIASLAHLTRLDIVINPSRDTISTHSYISFHHRLTSLIYTT